MSDNEETKNEPVIHLKVPTEIHRDTIKRRGMFAKRDKTEASSRRLLIADSVDDVLYPPPAPVRMAQNYTPIAKEVKTVDSAKIDESGRSVVSELTLDASARTRGVDASARTIDSSNRTEPSSNVVRQRKAPKAKSPKQKTKKTVKPKKSASGDDEDDDDDDSVSVLSDELSTISEKRSKKNGSSRSLSSTSSKKSATKKKKKTSKANRRASMKSMGSCESIDELTVTSGEMSFDGLSLADSITADSGSADAPVSSRSAATTDSSRRSHKSKKSSSATSRRSSTGEISKSSKKSKGSKKSSKGSVPMVIGSGCGGDTDEVSEVGEKPPSLMNSTLSDGGADTNAQESAVLSQGLQALGQFYE
ncbi:unnamed protein product [Cylindrotheca closterium]|uniref:Uncharacterized protein n=1 Tax=Cylindrotheca closterium TaxID=2856 RepID=A0AAD2GB83_9STRA|nr:unnamed protein product [Cylindrotheca closterium]